MTRARASTLRVAHQTMGDAADNWSRLRPRALRHYLLRHGVAHDLAVERVRNAQRRLEDFGFVVARARQHPDEPGRWVDDYTATLVHLRRQQRDPGFVLWEAFFRERAHILARGDASWPTLRVLLQLATEHGDDSPVTNACETWCEEHQTSPQLARTRRPKRATPSARVRTLTGHDEDLNDLTAWGRYLASICGEGRLLIWDTVTWRAVLQHKADALDASHVGYLTWWYEDRVWRWSPAWRAPVCSLALGEAWALCCATRHDGISLVGTDEGQLYLIPKEQEPARLVHLFDGSITRIEFLPGDSLLVELEHGDADEHDGEDERESGWADDDGEVCTFEEEDEGQGAEDDDDALHSVARLRLAPDGTCYDVETAHLPEGPALETLAWNADSNAAFGHRGDGTIWRIHAATGHSVRTYSGPHRFTGFLTADEAVFAWTLDGAIQMLGTNTLEVLRTIGSHGAPIHAGVLLSDGLLVTCGEDGTLGVWDTTACACVARLETGSPHAVLGAIELEGRRLLTWGLVGHLTLWCRETWTELGRLYGGVTSTMDIVSVGRGLFASMGFFSGDIGVWDPRFATASNPLPNHDDVVSAAAHRGGRVVTVAHDAEAHVWSLVSGEARARFSGHDKPVSCVLWWDDDTVWTGAWDGTLARWRVRDGALLSRVTAHEADVEYGVAGVRGVARLDDRRLVSWGHDGAISTLDVDHEVATPLHGAHRRAVHGLCKGANGLWVSWSEDGTARIWDMTARARIGLLDAGCWLEGAMWLDAERVITWDADLAVVPPCLRVWCWRSGRCLQILHPADAAVLNVVVHNGRLYAHQVQDLVYVWALEADTLRSEDATTLRELRTLSPEAWWAIRRASSSTAATANQLAYAEGGVIYLVNREGQEQRWHGTGDWSVHGLTEDGIVIASCWTDLAILRDPSAG